MTDFITSGGFEKYINRLRQTYLPRRNCLTYSLQSAYGDTSVKGLECGTHVVWDLPTALPDAENLQKIVRKKHVGIYTLQHHTIYNWQSFKNNKRVILLGYAAMNEDKIKKGIMRIADTIK